MDAVGTPFMTEFATCWGLLGGSLLIASPVIFFRVQDQSSLEDDLKFSDETAGDIGIPMKDNGGDDKDRAEYDHSSVDQKDAGAHEQTDTVVELPAQHDGDETNNSPPEYTEKKDSNAT